MSDLFDQSEKSIKVLQDARSALLAELSTRQEEGPLSSVLKQVEYLLAILHGKEKNFEKLSRLSIGVTTARMIEDELPTLAEKLYDADEIGRAMKKAFLSATNSST